MKLLVTGATGFTGSYTVPHLLAAGHEVTCFVRANSDLSHLPHNQVTFIKGDLDDPGSLTTALGGHDGLVNIASLGFGHAVDIVAAAQAAAVSRAVFVSTTAIFTSLNASSKVVRTAAENAIQQSGLPFTILRPTMIYGSGRDRNMCRLIQYMRRYPVLPVFGNGRYKQQPVYVGDVAAAITAVLAHEETIGQAYNIAGGSVVTYRELIELVNSLLNRRVWLWYLPARPIVAVLNMLQQLHIPLPIKGEQIQRLNEDKVFEYDAAAADFGYQPRSLEDGLKLALAAME